MDLITLIKTKNEILDTFLLCSKDLLNSIDNKNFNDINQFEALRSTLLHKILTLENKITALINSLQEFEKTDALIKSVRNLATISDRILTEIQTIDEITALKINEERKRLKILLNESDRNNNLMKKFKSSWVPNAGDRLDGTL